MEQLLVCIYLQLCLIAAVGHTQEKSVQFLSLEINKLVMLSKKKQKMQRQKTYITDSGDSFHETNGFVQKT